MRTKLKRGLLTDLSAVASIKITARINSAELIAKQGMHEMVSILIYQLDIEIGSSLAVDRPQPARGKGDFWTNLVMFSYVLTPIELSYYQTA